MCEWLSQAQWCDVQLLCRGRLFSAHRAVLASVSAFLRKILLSCNEEPSPTLIVLPDFDLEAMFSVLYYIYNGEVFIPTSSLEPFLDIITTLEIFIDKNFLSKLQQNLQGFDDQLQKINLHNKKLVERLSHPRGVFKLESDHNDNVYVTIKKGLYAHAQAITQRSLDATDTTLNCSQTQQLEPYLENMHLQQGDRQKKSFLRDSFIETYPRNGNVNGLTAAVPAITNEAYLETTSALLTNANGKDLMPVASNTDLSTIHYSRQADKTPDKQNFTFNIPEKLPYIFLRNLKNKINVSDIHNSESYKSEKSVALAPAVFEEQILPRKVSAFLDLRVAQSVNNAITAFQNKTYIYPYDTRPDVQQNRKCKGTFLTKTTISNQVMQNPWCSRMPISYRPFRRKPHKKTESVECAVEQNDRNNNFKSSLEVPDKVFPIEADLPKVAENHSTFQPVLMPSNIALKCDVCEQVFQESDALTNHVKSHSAARFSCTECHKTFSQLRNFKYHMSVHRGTREFAATCSVCGKYFNDRGYLSSHMKIHRNRKEYKCHICPKSFNQRVAYNMHVRIHTGVKPHVCDQCGKAFSRKMLLKQHQRTHSGERPYACPHCDKRFADRSNMTLHLRLHTGVKPFSCTLCPKSFTKKHHLKSHLNYHTGAKPYSCPRCHLAFTQSSNMRTHLKKCNISTSDVGSS